jgi:hypothetical protein
MKMVVEVPVFCAMLMDLQAGYRCLIEEGC